MTIDIISEPCGCPPGVCMHYCDPPEDCVNRFDATASVHHCERCEAGTWHTDGSCLRCKRRDSCSAG